jgi:hypothetical protein
MCSEISWFGRNARKSALDKVQSEILVRAQKCVFGCGKVHSGGIWGEIGTRVFGPIAQASVHCVGKDSLNR